MTPVTLTELVESHDPERWELAAQLIEAGEVPLGRVDEIRRKYPNFSDLLTARQSAREKRTKNH